MELVYSHASELWKASALEGVFHAACQLPFFTTEEVWPRMPIKVKVHDGRAMGNVMVMAKEKPRQWIAPTGAFAPSREDYQETYLNAGRRHRSSGQGLRLWRSLLFQDPDFNKGIRMSTKNNDPCLWKAGEDEPIFVLRAQDKLAPEIVRTWAAVAHTKGVPFEKVDEALRLASSMEEWAANNRSKLPD